MKCMRCTDICIDLHAEDIASGPPTHPRTLNRSSMYQGFTPLQQRPCESLLWEKLKQQEETLREKQASFRKRQKSSYNYRKVLAKWNNVAIGWGKVSFKGKGLRQARAGLEHARNVLLLARKGSESASKVFDTREKVLSERQIALNKRQIAWSKQEELCKELQGSITKLPRKLRDMLRQEPRRYRHRACMSNDTD